MVRIVRMPTLEKDFEYENERGSYDDDWLVDLSAVDLPKKPKRKREVNCQIQVVEEVERTPHRILLVGTNILKRS